MFITATAMMLASSASAIAPPTRTEVKSLPGYGSPPSKMFAGFSSGGVPPSGKGNYYYILTSLA
jgi:hypothetical protein